MEPLPIHYLYPAALFASKEPHLVNTILGSCVSICLWDMSLKIGGINHYMLPLWNGDGLASPKYGNIAIERLLEKMIQFGSNPKNLQAKVFGGGEVLETKNDHFVIGERNIRMAYDTLKDLRIQVVASSVSGKKGRKIQFKTDTGEVKMKFIEKTTSINIPK